MTIRVPLSAPPLLEEESDDLFSSRLRDRLRELFEERPVWTRAALEAQLHGNDDKKQLKRYGDPAGLRLIAQTRPRKDAAPFCLLFHERPMEIVLDSLCV